MDREQAAEEITMVYDAKALHILRGEYLREEGWEQFERQGVHAITHDDGRFFVTGWPIGMTKHQAKGIIERGLYLRTVTDIGQESQEY